jgi:hypothetical protein
VTRAEVLIPSQEDVEDRALEEEVYAIAARAARTRSVTSARREFDPPPGPHDDVHVYSFTEDDVDVWAASEHRRHHARQHRQANRARARGFGVR